MSGNDPPPDDEDRRLEQALIEAALKRTQGHRREAVDLIGWGRKTPGNKPKGNGKGKRKFWRWW